MNILNASQEFQVGKHGIGWLDSDFSKAFDGFSFDAAELPPFQKLPRYMKDAEIEKEITGGKYASLGQVISLLDDAPGEYKDGYSNLFYFPQCVVYVLWHAGDGGWLVSAWRRGGIGWSAGRRVFSPATDTAALNAAPLDTLKLSVVINGIKYVPETIAFEEDDEKK